MRMHKFPTILRAAENEGGSAEVTGTTTTTADAGSVLFPDEGNQRKHESGQGDTTKNAAEGNQSGAADWKEYETDPNKSAEENAAAKAEHDKAKPADKSADPKDVADQVPENGKYQLSMPEGVEVDQELLDALGPKLAAKKMSNREAQELADGFIELQRKREEDRVKAWTETVEQWQEDAKKDKEIGGVKWEGTKRDAIRAVNAYGTAELKNYLHHTGGGNHPELIRFMAKVGSTIKEDSPAAGGVEGAGKPAEAAHLLFPNDAPKGN